MTTKMSTLLPLTVVLLAASSGCGDDLTCAAGTVAAGDECVPDPAAACGLGTALIGGVCRPVGLNEAPDASGAPQIPDPAPCEPACAEGAACGPNGCGGTCGTCTAEVPYCVAGACAATCDPGCGEAECGPDACGGTCGECPAERGCAPSRRCVPAEWTCSPLGYADGTTCDCLCGAPDPDCTDPERPVSGCTPGATCDAGGGCAACRPVCDGVSCGSDGCGGSCGECTSKAPFCLQGQCSATCDPDCVGKSCGPDGCGALCGVCADGDLCSAGTCTSLEASLSCEGHCGTAAPSGCACAAGCGDGCCADFDAACGCQADCAGKACGDDGCGGPCGFCSAGDVCLAAACVADPCLLDPCHGHGTCELGACTCAPKYAGASCEACADGLYGYPACADLCEFETCSAHGTCDPANGACDCEAGYSGTHCDGCSTGFTGFPSCVVDPCAGVDCQGAGACVPATATCDCLPAFTGPTCGACADAQKTWPDC